MTKITREEVLKLAALSKIEILDSEIDAITQQLQSVLSYAESVQDIAGDADIESDKNVNVFAQDIVSKTDCGPILKQAPECEDNFFVVPKVLEDK